MKDNTFIIDSNNLDAVQPRLYGYAISDEGELIFDEVPRCKNRIGIYTFVDVTPDEIIISQDPSGSFGLYVYQDSSRFIFSNSFFRLAEQLNGAFTYNKPACKALYYSMYVPLEASATLVNEIKRLEPDAEVHINRHARTFSITQKPITMFARTFDSEEDFRVLDRWYIRWMELFRGLASHSYPLTVDLSGGIDSRIVLSMFINANIDLNSVCALSHDKVALKKDAEDYRIAQEIAGYYGFALNNKAMFPTEKVGSLSAAESYTSMKYTSLDCSISSKYPYTDYLTPIVAVKGLGSLVKGWNWESPEAAIKDSFKFGFAPFRTVPPLAQLHQRADRDQLSHFYKAEVDEMLMDRPYKNELAGSYLFSRQIVSKLDAHKCLDKINCNEITVTPFFDPDIVEFHYHLGTDDRYMLAGIILGRYCPKLLEFDVQGNKLSKNVLSAASTYAGPPVSLPAYERLSASPVPAQKRTLAKPDLKSFLEDIYASQDFERNVTAVLPARFFKQAMRLKDKERINSNAYHMNALLALHELEKLRRQ